MKTRNPKYPYSRRIVGAELPTEGKAILISDYTIRDKGNKDYVIDLANEENPFVQVDMPFGGGVSASLARVLGVDPDTHICTGLDPRYWEGLRTLHFYFRDLDKPLLDLSREPWAKFPYWGYMFGSEGEGEGRLKIPGADCFVDPYVWSSADKDFFETAMSTQGSDVAILSGRDINTVGRFVYPRLPNNKWLESEVDRFKRNGETTSRKKLLERLQQMNTGLDDYIVRGREILAWPTAAQLP